MDKRESRIIKVSRVWIFSIVCWEAFGSTISIEIASTRPQVQGMLRIEFDCVAAFIRRHMLAIASFIYFSSNEQLFHVGPLFLDNC